MAYDKVIDSAKLDKALTASANALRAKTGGTGKINFDLANETGFSETITNLPAGGGDDTLDKLISREITEVTSNATSIGKYAFRNCSNLTTANMPLATSIGDYAFYSCSELTTVDFPLVTSIASNAFESCSSLTTADFPSVTSVGSGTFRYCYKFITLILRSETMATLSSASSFQSCYHFFGNKNSTHNPTGAKDGYFYVPRALVDSYKTATNWSTLETQFRALEDYTVDGTITGELDPNKI